MEISISHQCRSFLLAIGVGAALSLLYDLFRLLHLFLPENRLLIAAEDLCYLFICAWVTMDFALWADMGRLRAYIFLGEGLGWTLCHFSLSQFFVEFASKVLQLFFRILRLLFRPLQLLFRIVRNLLHFFGSKMGKIFKKIALRLKFSLKHRVILLYNLIKSEKHPLFRKR